MWQAIRLLYKFNWRYKYAFIGGMFFLIVGRILANFSVFFFKFFVEEIQAGNISTLINLLIAVVFVRLLTTILEITADYINDKYIINGARDIQEAVFSHLHHLDYIFHTNRRSGGLISAMKRGGSAAFSFNIELNRNIPRLIIDFLFLLTTFYFLNFKLMLVLAGFVLFFLIIARYLVKLNVTKRREVNDQEDLVSGIVVDNIINYETVKFFAREDWEEKRLHETNNKYLKAVWGYVNSFRLIDFTEGVVSTLGIVIISLIAIQDTLAGNMSLSEFVLVFTFVTNFFPKFADLVYKLGNWQKMKLI